MASQRIERKLAAILAADVVGYSRLMAKGEEATLRTLRTHLAAIQRLVSDTGGRVFGGAGDSVVAEFASVVEALRCAVEIQQAVKTSNADLSEDDRMHFRIGVNLGEVMVEGDNLLGHVVNVAARLEGLAEPGGICISADVYRYANTRLELGFEDLGNQPFKNLAEPVHVYRVLMEPGAAGGVSGLARRIWKRRSRRLLAAAVVMVLAAAGAAVWRLYLPGSAGPGLFAFRGAQGLKLPDKPSIAVLPLDNLSADPSQDYFSDGMTEDIITELSRLPDLFVIARNSVFAYKGKPVKAQQISRELGVRYVLEGSVQKSGDRVRITAQLIDATTGHHLWAERFDRNIQDLFAVQDEVTQKIVVALADQVSMAELQRVRREGTKSMDAYDYVLHGLDHVFRFSKEENAKARDMYERAIALDPGYARAYALLAWTYLNDWNLGWSEDPRQSLERAFEIARRAVALDDSNAFAHGALGAVYLWRKQHEQAVAELERAIALNPNDADRHAELGDILTWAGRPEEGMKQVEMAMRLNPNYPFFYLWFQGHAYFVTGRYEEAVVALTAVRDRSPRFGPAYVYLAASYAQLGRIDQARAAKAQADPFFPDWSDAHMREVLPYGNPADLQRLLDGLRKAGRFE